MPRNILIDPQRTGTSNPNIQFSGSMANTIKLEVLTSGSVQFTGVSGSLLSVTDSLSGSLFAVSDVSGLPILETFSDDRVVMGRFNTNALVVTGSRVGIGSSNPSSLLDVNDSVNYTGIQVGSSYTYNTYWADYHVFKNNKLVGNTTVTIANGVFPGTNNSYDLGSTSLLWRNVYAANISGSLTGSNVTAGQVVVAGTGGVLSGSNNFWWSNSNNRVGIGSSTPQTTLDVGGFLHLGYDSNASNYSGISLHHNNIYPGSQYYSGLYHNNASGQLNLSDQSGAVNIYISNNASYPFRIYSSAWGGSSYTITERLKVDGSNGNVTPGADNSQDLGGSNLRWANVYANSISGSLTGSNVTAGQVVLAGTGGVLSGSNSFFWDNTNRRVGIGTSTSLSYPLTVNSPASQTSVVYVRSSDTTGAALFLGDSSGILGQFYMVSGGTWIDYNTSLRFRSGYGGAERMRIDSSGNVGIGTDTYTARLHVSGSTTGTATTLLARHGIPNGSNLPVLDVQNSAGTSLLFVSGSGWVGIGSTQPVATFNSLATADGMVGMIAGPSYGAKFISAGGNGMVIAATDPTGTSTHRPMTLQGTTITLLANANAVSTPSVYIDTNQNVGVGSTTTLTARFQVSGSGTATTPTMVVREGVVSPTGGVGTFDIQNSAGTSLFFVSGSGNVGVGTATPAARFHVHGNQYISNGSLLTNTVTFYSGGTVPLSLGNIIFIRDSDGNVGIGTSAMSDRLAVNGTMSVTGSYLAPGVDNSTTLGTNTKRWLTVFAQNLSGSLTRLADGTSYLVAGSNVTITTGSNGAVTINASLAGGAVSGTGTTNYVTKWTSTTSVGNSVLYDDGANVGINTTSMTFRLEVSGSDARIHDVRIGRGAGSVVSNTAVGNGALNSNSTGVANTAIGRNSLNAVSVGNYNTAVGQNALVGATSSNNTAVGDGSAYSLTSNGNVTAVGQTALAWVTGGSNTAVGTESLHGNSSSPGAAANNTAVGYRAGYSITTGTNNAFLGYQAGQTLTTGANNVILGSGALTVAAADSNSIVIGSGSLGRGSNTTVIGNASTTLTLIPSGSLAMGGTAAGANAVSLGINNTASGNQSVAIGNGNVASGTGGFALGTLSTASTGGYNFAIGSSTLATGITAIAMGNNTTASGAESQAIGRFSLASGAQSVAIGSYVTGSAVSSVAIGRSNNVSGIDGVALGNGNTVSGQSAAVIGTNSQAYSTGAQAFGVNAYSSNAYATAIGVNVGATGNSSVAIGNLTTASGQNSIATGYNNTASGPSSFTAGQFSLASGAQSVAIGSYVTGSNTSAIAIGNGSVASNISAVALGASNTASGQYSTATGYANGASGLSSFAAGQGNTASGQYSVVLGQTNSGTTNNAVAIGVSNTAGGTAAVALGSSNGASGYASFAAGYSNTANNYYAVALSAYNTASNYYSIAAGAYNTASGISAVAMGQYSLASGAQAIAMGNAATGSFPGAVAIGSGSLASSTEALVFGARNTASGPNAIAIGNNSTASFTGSIAIGALNTASAQSATAIGGSNTASGGYSFASGYNSTASGFGSIAMGGGANVANTTNAIAMGSTNTSSGNTAIAMGRFSLASGAQAIAIGSYVTGSNTSAVAIGVSNTASGQNAVAIGNGNVASSTTAVAIGNTNTASTGIYAVAIGQANTSSGVVSVAIGNNNVASADNSFATGRSGKAYLWAQRSHSANAFASQGDAQISSLVVRNSTTDATVTELFLETSSSTRLVLPASTTWDADITVVARASTGTSHASFRRRCLISRNASNTTALVGSVQVVGSDIGSNVGSPPTGWAVTVSADDTNESLKIEVTGAVSTNIRWVARIELVEVGY